MKDHAQVTEADGVLTVTLDRDEKLNAISDQMTEALWEAVDAVRERDDLRALVITAVGRYFTAGIDLHSRTGGGQEVDPNDPARGGIFRHRIRRHHMLYDEMEALEKPVILAAQSHCLGAGLEMAVSCDFRLAAASATFSLPEIRLGVTSASGGTSRLARLVGPGWARWLAMAGKSVDAQTALMIGLVQQVLPDEGFHEAVHDFAVELIQLPREALGVAKLTIDAALSTDRATARDIDRLAATTLIFGPAFQQNLSGFRSSGAKGLDGAEGREKDSDQG